MADIFISYRREDSAGHAGRLYDGLQTRFTGAQVFIDVDSIQPGVDFVKHMQDAVARCDVLLVIIGDEWARITDHEGKRRLDDPQDFVRVEVAAALERDVPVLPVLIEGAKMPEPEELPEDIRPLSRHNAIELSDARWRYDVTRLEDAITRLAPATGEQVAVPAGGEPEKRPPWALIGGGVAAVIAVALVAIVVLGGSDDTPSKSGASASASFAPCGRVDEPSPAAVFADPRTTTCPFARNVAKAALPAAEGGGESFDITAFSPRTSQDVAMSCNIDAGTIECRGGRDAVVRVAPDS